MKNYFKGWFFKHSSNILNIAFIPSYSIINHEKKCYIQVITDYFSDVFEFEYSKFYVNNKDFYIKIDNNTFSSQGISINLEDKDYKIVGEFKYSNHININTNIMGPFKNIPFMECKHQLYSMKHNVTGNIIINNNAYHFENDLGYIEGDSGKSFPKDYYWIQSNNFESDAAFFLSIATIPYLKIKFQGLIASLIVKGKEYRFATYNFSKILSITEKQIQIKKKDLLLYVYFQTDKSHQLLSPTNGVMERIIYESINGEIKLELYIGKELIFSGIGKNAGVEIGK